MDKENRAKITRLTTILVIAVVIPLLLFWVAVVYFLRDFAQKNTLSNNLTTARVVSRLIQKSFADTFYHLENHKEELISGLKTNNQKEIEHELKEVLYTSPLISSLAMVNPDGSGFIHYVMPGRLGHKQLICPLTGKLNGSQLGWFQDYLKYGKGKTVSNVFYSPCNPNYPQIAAVLPIKDAEGKLVVVQSASFDLTAIKSWFQPLKLPVGMYITLLDRKNQLIYSSQPLKMKATANTRTNVLADYQPLVSLLNKQNKAVSVYTNPLSKQKEVVAMLPVLKNSLTVLVGQPLTLAQKTVAITSFHFLLLFLALLFFALLLINLVRRVYIKQNEALAREAKLKKALARSVQELKTTATTLQQSFFPSDFPSFPGYEFGATYHSATKHALIGGDFYDLFLLDKNHLCLVLGDVSGKGIEATTATALVKNVLKAFALEKPLTPVAVINKANHVLTRILGGHFATVFFGVFDKNGFLTYVNCGHPPAFLLQKDGLISALEYTGMPLGFEFSYDCLQKTATVNPGELLLLYTDGLTELRQENVFLGEEGVKKALQNCQNLTTAAVPLAVYQAAEDFCGGQLHDDIAVVAIKRVAASLP